MKDALIKGVYQMPGNNNGFVWDLKQFDKNTGVFMVCTALVHLCHVTTQYTLH